MYSYATRGLGFLVRCATISMRSPKRKSSEIDASPQLPISTGVQLLDRSRLPWSVRSIDRDYQGQLSWRLKSRVLMYSYATRGLGFLVRCATISRQLGQGRQRSGGSPLFMINHRSSNNNWGEPERAPQY